MHTVDFLIIGQGLAGSLLAYSLIKRGQSVLVIDNEHNASATQVAAGLINPITGHRLNITDRFFSYSSTAKKLYWQIERDLGCSIYSEIPQTRLIKNAGQADYLEQRKQQADYDHLLGDIENTGGWFAERDTYPHGAINVRQTAVIDTRQLLYQMQNWLLERESLLYAKLDYKQLKVIANKVEFRHSTTVARSTTTASKVIFCEGFQAIHNPWLQDLPFKLAKGEILTVEPSTNVDRMLSWGNWLVPNQNNRQARLGSNYLWNDTTLTKSADAAETFLASLKDFTGISAKVVSHAIGIRPSTVQRKPFVGPLSNFEKAYCLNGLGSKGCLIAPHYVALLCDHLLLQQDLPEETTRWL